MRIKECLYGYLFRKVMQLQQLQATLLHKGGAQSTYLEIIKFVLNMGGIKTTSPASFSLENKMVFATVSDSRALFASSHEQIKCCCAGLSQSCSLVGMFQVFLMQKERTQRL